MQGEPNLSRMRVTYASKPIKLVLKSINNFALPAVEVIAVMVFHAQMLLTFIGTIRFGSLFCTGSP